MAFIDNDEINKIRAQADIATIISSLGIEVIPSGKDFKCVCPFHNDHSPSLNISSSKQIFKCFACGAGGNVFAFVERFENITFPEAVKYVADRVGYNLKTNISTIITDKYKIEHEIYNFACMFYQNNLNTSSGIIAKKYLKERKIDDKIINDFKIGLALDNKNDLFNFLVKKGYKIPMLEDIGLINIINDKAYDFFSSRITFPLEDTNGNIVGFSSRIYRGEKDVSKYVNTKETKLYIKGNNLYNYCRAKTQARKEKKLIVVEGQMDAIRVYSSGIENVVALGGTALTQNQIKLIKNLNCEVILCLDGDNAGSLATIKNGDLLTNDNIIVKVVRLSDYKDPDEYIINKGIDAYKNNIENPIDYLEFKMDNQEKEVNINNSEELASLINKLLIDISKIKDDIQKEIMLKKISNKYDLSMELLKNKLKEITSAEKVAKEVFEVKTINKKQTGLDIAIKKVLYYMMCDKKYIKIYQNKIGFFENRLYRDIANEIVYFSQKCDIIYIADFISYIQRNEELAKEVADIIDNDISELNEIEFDNYVKVINQKSQEQQIKELKNQIKKEMDVNKKKELLERIANIKKGSVINESN